MVLAGAVVFVMGLMLFLTGLEMFQHEEDGALPATAFLILGVSLLSVSAKAFLDAAVELLALLVWLLSYVAYGVGW